MKNDNPMDASPITLVPVLGGVTLTKAGWTLMFVPDDQLGILASALKARQRELRRLQVKADKKAKRGDV